MRQNEDTGDQQPCLICVKGGWEYIHEMTENHDFYPLMTKIHEGETAKVTLTHWDVWSIVRDLERRYFSYKGKGFTSLLDIYGERILMQLSDFQYHNIYRAKPKIQQIGAAINISEKLFEDKQYH